MDIEIYEKMALYQTKLAIKNLLKNLIFTIIMHRYGNQNLKYNF